MLPDLPILQFARFNERFDSRHPNRLHDHQNWQVELIVCGSPRLLLEDGTHSLHPGDIVIIPPEVSHDFEYLSEKTSWFTIRFLFNHTHAANCACIAKQGCNPRFFDLLTTLLSDAGRHIDQITQRTVESILQGLLLYNLGNDESPSPANVHIEKIHDYLSQNCHRAVSVDELARCIGYSSSHARALYKAATGKSLKRAIDDARYNEAYQYLLHSDYTISEIADALGFPEVYSFSRFIQRKSGKSPRGIRRLHLTEKE